MLQESVYCKLVLNPTAATLSTEQIRKNSPPKGVVQVLTITEKQFSRIEYVIGTSETNIVNSDKRTLIL